MAEPGLAEHVGRPRARLGALTLLLSESLSCFADT